MPVATEDVHWEPQPGPQTALLTCPVEDVLFGGARGGGKTDGLLGDWLSHEEFHGEHARGILFRRSYPELEEIQERAQALFGPIAPEGWHGTSRTWTFPSGARLKFRHMDRDVHANKYQGHSYTWLAFDELTHWPDPAPVDKLRATLRSAHGVPCLFRATANPGGPGHNWVKARYIDPASPYEPRTDPDSGTERVFIPSRLEDNLVLVESDPDYWRRVEAAAAGNQALLKAWREGRWDIVAGGMFDDLWDPARHVLPQFVPPEDWDVYRAFDWGSSKPFSVGWWARANGSTAALPDGREFRPPPGSFVRVGEWYGWDGKRPNRGLRMTDSEIGRGIVEREERMGLRKRIRPGPADPSIFSADPGKTAPSDALAQQGARFTKANAGPGSIQRGCEALRRMLGAAASERPEEPGLWVTDSCRQFIRTVPVLPRSEKKPEEYDSDAEDHCLHPDTLVDTLAGPSRIEDLVGTSGHVLSIDGRWEAYRSCRLTKRGASVVRVHLTDGRTVVATGNHRFLTSDGRWVEAESLRRGTVLCSVDHPQPLNCGTRSACTRETEGQYAGPGRERHNPGVSGRALLPLRAVLPAEGAQAPPRGLASAQRTDTRRPPCAPRNGRSLAQPDRGLGLDRRHRAPDESLNGAGAERSEPTERGGGAGSGIQVASERRGPRVAPGALRGERAPPLRRDGEEGLRALRRPLRHTEAHGSEREILLQPLQGGSPSGLGGGRRRARVRGMRQAVYGEQVQQGAGVLPLVRQEPAVVDRVEPAGRSDVYCLEVPATSAFAVEGGIIVHNCADETRYMVTATSSAPATSIPSPVGY